MKPQEVELVLLEQSLANADSTNRPFFDRVRDIAEKTGGSMLFDVRVDGDPHVGRMAAIGFGEDGSVAILMDKYGKLTSAPIREDTDPVVADLAAWASLPMAKQVHVAYRGTAAILLAKLRKSDAS